MRDGYIFLCNDETEAECLERLLLGGREDYRNRTKKVKSGDTLFLYNFTGKRLHGTFTAISDPALNIIPDAWGGGFPWQVRIKREKEYKPITKADIGDVLGFSWSGFPAARVLPEQMAELKRFFESENRLPVEEEDYRNRYDAEKITADGHRVRSQGEVVIDNWLFKNRIVHGYECRVKEARETMYCDFYIPKPDGNNIYIEFWGKEDKRYKKRQKYKIGLYKKYCLDLIEITPNELKKLDSIFTLKRTSMKNR